LKFDAPYLFFDLWSRWRLSSEDSALLVGSGVTHAFDITNHTAMQNTSDRACCKVEKHAVVTFAVDRRRIS